MSENEPKSVTTANSELAISPRTGKAIVDKRDAKGLFQKGNTLAAKRNLDVFAKKERFQFELLHAVKLQDWSKIVNQLIVDCTDSNSRIREKAREQLMNLILPKQRMEVDATITGRNLTREEEMEIIKQALDKRLGLIDTTVTDSGETP